MPTTIRRALLSVSDKVGLEGFARALVQRGVELLATGGTRRALEAAAIPSREVAEVTGFPEMMDGRVKTLHPRIHGGLLALRDEREHVEAMQRHGIPAIDLVVVNLYPFEATAARAGATRAQIVEQIDIGGPSMVRSAAKNHRFVTVVVDPADYGGVLAALESAGGGVPDDLRRALALKAFATTARYDAAICAWLHAEERRAGQVTSPFPAVFALSGSKASDLRYGENPHQQAALYRTPAGSEPAAARAEMLGGKPLSFNNLVDLDAALELAKEFDAPFACVVKHNNPCGAAAAEGIARALAEAWASDPVSAFGSVIALTRPLDRGAAEFLLAENRFVEAIIAPSLEPEACALLVERAKWGRNVRLLACGPIGPAAREPAVLEAKHLTGGFLVQTRDLSAEHHGDLRMATKRAATQGELQGLLFAARVAKHVKSNAIVLAQSTRVVGVGAGQMSRVDAVRLAVAKAGASSRGAVLASDAFFPFPDGVEAALDAGVTAVLQPGGSVRDAEVIAACDARGAAMVMTGRRHFRH
jgi:phosphoribosylaminoimidazolecarboxamide formyltransferase/IMP cyclohydrolase